MCRAQHRFLSLRRFLFLAILAGLTIGPVLPALAYQSIHDDGTSRLQPWTNCTPCHGADLMGGIGPACTTCHQPFSSPDLPPVGHHVSGREDATKNCVLCHGSDLMGADLGGGVTTPSCYSCHGQLWNSGTGGENSPPTAVPGGPYAATVGVAIQFDGSGSTDPDGDTLTYIWDFGDGSFPSGGGSPTASHAYTTAGTYTATLAVADGVNLPVAATVEVTITNTNAPPTASAGGPYTGTANQSVQFDASGSSDPDGDTLSYTWDFGDGSAVAGPSGNATASHTYQTAGMYVATVTVSDGVNDPVTSDADVDIAEDTGGGGGGGGGPIPTGNDWDVQYPWLGIAGTVSFNDFGPWFLVTQTVDNGPATPGFGFRLDNNVVWLDASGSMFVGFQPAAADSMWGMVFNFPGGVNSIWFAQPQAPPPAPDLGALGDLLGSGFPDLGSLLGGTGSGSGSTGSTGDTSGSGSSTTTGGDTSSSGTTGGSTTTTTTTTTSTRPRAYDVYQQRNGS